MVLISFVASSVFIVIVVVSAKRWLKFGEFRLQVLDLHQLRRKQEEVGRDHWVEVGRLQHALRRVALLQETIVPVVDHFPTDALDEVGLP